MAEKSREQKQAAARREIRVTPRSRALLDQYAENHFMSRSEAMRLVLEKIASGESPARKPQRYTERIVFYDPGLLMTRVLRKATVAGIPTTDLLDQAIEELLT